MRPSEKAKATKAEKRTVFWREGPLEVGRLDEHNWYAQRDGDPLRYYPSLPGAVRAACDMAGSRCRSLDTWLEAFRAAARKLEGALAKKGRL